MAACSGVMRTSRWPIEVCAERGVVLDVADAAAGSTGSGISKLSPSMPKASAISRTVSSPRSMPSWAKAVLQEIGERVDQRLLAAAGCRRPPLKFSSVVLRAGQREHVGRRDRRSRACSPSSSAAADTITLNIEPGG